MNANEFICPECGSRDARRKVFVTSIPEQGVPWSEVLQQAECASCRSVIPAHLAERWDDLPLAEAQAAWKATYRDSQPEREHEAPGKDESPKAGDGHRETEGDLPRI